MDQAEGAAPPATGGHWSGRRTAAVVIASLLVVAAGGLGWLAGRGDDDRAGPAEVTGRSVCEPLAVRLALPSQLPEVVIYLRAGITEAELEDVGRRLDADDRVAYATYVDVDETYEEFRRLFRGQETMLENVLPGDLPTSLEVHLEDRRNAAALVRSLEGLHLDTIYRVANNEPSGASVLDGLVWPGHDPEARADASSLAALVYGKRWRGLADAVVRAARADGDQRLADAVDLLVAEVARRPRTPRAANATVAVDVAAAAAVVQATAAERCDRRPIGFFTDDDRTRTPGG